MKRFIFALMLLLLTAGIYASANRETLSISGILKTADGNYLNGNYSIDFDILTTAGGTSVYDENHNGSQAPQVAVTNGYFSVTLGDTNVLPISLFTADYNLAMNIGSTGWLSPTIRLNAAPNAVVASRALDFNVARDLNVTGSANFATALTDGNLADITSEGKVKLSALNVDLNAQYFSQSDANTVLMLKADMNSQYARLNASNTLVSDLIVSGDINVVGAKRLLFTYGTGTDENTMVLQGVSKVLNGVAEGSPLIDLNLLQLNQYITGGTTGLYINGGADADSNPMLALGKGTGLDDINFFIGLGTGPTPNTSPIVIQNLKVTDKNGTPNAAINISIITGDDTWGSYAGGDGNVNIVGTAIVGLGLGHSPALWIDGNIAIKKETTWYTCNITGPGNDFNCAGI